MVETGRARINHLFELVRRLESLPFPAPVDQLEHSLQVATRAWTERAPLDLVLGALTHDVGRLVSPDNHGYVSAELILPFVSERTYWIVRVHDRFMWRHAPVEFDGDREARELFRDRYWFQDACTFADEWDRNAFSRTARSLPLAFFRGLLTDFCLDSGRVS